MAEAALPRRSCRAGEDKGPLADMIRRHSSGQQVGGDLDPAGRTRRRAGVVRVVGVPGLGGRRFCSASSSSEESRLKRQVAQAS